MEKWEILVSFNHIYMFIFTYLVTEHCNINNSSGTSNKNSCNDSCDYWLKDIDNDINSNNKKTKYRRRKVIWFSPTFCKLSNVSIVKYFLKLIDINPWRCTSKEPTSDINICRLYKAFDSIHRGKMEQILLAYGIPKETVAAITILYRNTKVKVRSPDGDTEYFDIVAGVLQGDTLAPYLFIICLDYVLRTSIDKIKENGFRTDEEKKQKIPRNNNYRRQLRRWHSDTGKYTWPSRNSSA